MKHSLTTLVLFFHFALSAQPDTLWVPTNGQLLPYAVVYEPVRMDAQYKRIGKFAVDTTKVAVSMDHKRGHASGVYRAYYPDGRPLIFAVYGWDSPHGDWTEYDETGAVSLKGQYRGGLRDGTWAFKKEGIIGHYKNGLKHGTWKHYEGSIPVRTEKYKKDKLKRTKTLGTR
jgi:antitoxin component YwqK of YwqJK toxin-antitoxin module